MLFQSPDNKIFGVAKKKDNKIFGDGPRRTGQIACCLSSVLQAGPHVGLLGNLGSRDVGFDGYGDQPAGAYIFQKPVCSSSTTPLLVKAHKELARFVLPSRGCTKVYKSNNVFDKCGKAKMVGEGCTS